MKKAAAILLAISVLFLVGCNDSDGDVKKPKETAVTVTTGDCFEINKLKGEDGNEKFSYTVKTHDGTVIESAVCANEPKVKPLSDDLLGVRFYTATDSFVRYYDIKGGRVSASYFGAFWDNGELLAYNDFEASGKLIVRDIFDDNGYRYEKEITSDSLTLIVTKAEPTDDGETLVVKFKLGDHGAEKNVRLPLVDKDSDGV